MRRRGLANVLMAAAVAFSVAVGGAGAQTEGKSGGKSTAGQTGDGPKQTAADKALGFDKSPSMNDIHDAAKAYVDQLDGGALIPKAPHMPLCVTPEDRALLQEDYETWKRAYKAAITYANTYLFGKMWILYREYDLEQLKKAAADATSNAAFGDPSQAKALKAKREAALKAVTDAENALAATRKLVDESEGWVKKAVASLQSAAKKQASDAAKVSDPTKVQKACPPPQIPSTGGMPPKDNPPDTAPEHSSKGKTGCPDGVLAELNAARADPAAYATKLETLRPYYHGKTFAQPGHPPAMTTEGVAAVDDAIAYLRARPPAPPLTLSAALTGTASRLVLDLGPTGGVGHVGSDGSTMSSRIREAGVFAQVMEEDISLAQATPEGIVRQLIIDDGVASRGHRTAIFSPNLTLAGAACGPHKVYGSMAVIDFTSAPMQR